MILSWDTLYEYTYMLLSICSRHCKTKKTTICIYVLNKKELIVNYSIWLYKGVYRCFAYFFFLSLPKNIIYKT